MQIVVPMAGIGKRFLEAGYQTPKPLIEVDGKSMIEHIINLFREKDNFTFIINKEHDKKHQLKNKLLELKPGSQVLAVLYQGMGPVWSTLEIEENIKEEEPTIITYCDFNMSWDQDEFEIW